jgi:hypothetical protein
MDEREDHLIHGVDYPLCKVCGIGLPNQFKREGENNYCRMHNVSSPVPKLEVRIFMEDLETLLNAGIGCHVEPEVFARIAATYVQHMSPACLERLLHSVNIRREVCMFHTSMEHWSRLRTAILDEFGRRDVSKERKDG